MSKAFAKDLAEWRKEPNFERQYQRTLSQIRARQSVAQPDVELFTKLDGIVTQWDESQITAAAAMEQVQYLRDEWGHILSVMAGDE